MLSHYCQIFNELYLLHKINFFYSKLNKIFAFEMNFYKKTIISQFTKQIIFKSFNEYNTSILAKFPLI